MELQVPYSICAKIQTEGVFRRKTPGDKRNTTETMPMEGCRNYRRRSMPGSHTYVSEHPAQNERFGVYGIFEREKLAYGILKVG